VGSAVNDTTRNMGSVLGVALVAAGLVVAFRTFRPVRAAAEVVADVPGEGPGAGGGPRLTGRLREYYTI
jgi:hypothetical protein